jgi:putative FmdB family regulatory protein
MPFYEYRCGQCQELYIDLRPVQDRDKSSPCPECGSRNTVRTVSAFSTGGATTSLSVDRGGSCGESGFS